MNDKIIEQILNYPTKDIIKAMLTCLQGHQITSIRQTLAPRWQDGFHFSLFDLWYRDNEADSPARLYFTPKGRSMKHYPEQGWAPEDSGMVDEFECRLCGMMEDSDDLLLNHFRNGGCEKFDYMVENAISADEFWKKMEVYKRG